VSEPRRQSRTPRAANSPNARTGPTGENENDRNPTAVVAAAWINGFSMSARARAASSGLAAAGSSPRSATNRRNRWTSLAVPTASRSTGSTAVVR
jgi:hypothetical protein